MRKRWVLSFILKVVKHCVFLREKFICGVRNRYQVKYKFYIYDIHNINNNNDNDNNNNNNNNNGIQGANQDFFTISSLWCKPSPTRTLKWPGRNRVQITCNTSSDHHVQHVVLHAMWYEGTAQLLSLTELKSHLFELYFLAEPLN